MTSYSSNNSSYLYSTKDQLMAALVSHRLIVVINLLALQFAFLTESFFIYRSSIFCFSMTVLYII
ncbi:hypothetical protein, partial [Bacillus paranthracis]|uniref:hypothetical protein n=1 Tax=Bacillus paranthracis TaxID=2026186 RepID=UPI0039A02811